MNKQKVLVGMSGGVDSSVAASMLIDQGYEVHGIFVEAYNEPGCRTDQDKKDALQVALKLGIPFQVLDCRSEYKKRVVDYFINEYQSGRTPNPDIICNRDIKFGLLYEYMEKNGYDYLATGHYSRISCGSTKSEIINSKQILNSKKTNDKYYLQQPVDLGKDQTYFLWQIAREKLGKILWPLGGVLKSWVRQRAHELGLPNADKPDSMGVCMIGELNVASFLKQKLGVNRGKVMWKNQAIGTHDGLWFYTIGSRGGWSIDNGVQSAAMPPLYVVRKRVDENVIEVGERAELMYHELRITNYELRESSEPMWVRIRNLGELVEVSEYRITKKELHIITSVSVFAPAPGQSAVFYDSEGLVVGGGIIAEH